VGKKKIIVIDPRASSPQYDESLIVALRKAGADASLFTADFYPSPWEEADLISGRKYYFLRLSRFLRRKWKNNSLLVRLSILLSLPEYIIDLIRLSIYCFLTRPVLHIQWVFVIPLDLAFMFLMRCIGLRIIYTVHNPLPHDQNTALNRFLYRCIYSLATHLVFHSQATVDDFSKIFPSPKNGTYSIIPHGVSFAARSPVDREEARSRLGWKDDQMVLVFQGQVKHYKGLDILLEALAGLQTDKSVRFVIAANFRFAKKDTYDTLIKRAKKKVQVDIFDAMPTDDECVDLTCGADLFVLPYRSGTASMPGMMALRFGTPLIVSDVGALPDMLGKSLEKYIVPPDDASALREKIEMFLTLNVTQRKAFGEVLKRRGEQKFSWDSIATETIVVYHGTENQT